MHKRVAPVTIPRHYLTIRNRGRGMSGVLDAWLEKLERATLPALQHSVEHLAALTADENTPLERLAAAIERDPGLTVRLLRLINAVPYRHLRREVTTVEHGLMMLGIERLRTLPTGVPILEQTVKEEAKPQLYASYVRAYHAAYQAYDWSRLRKDAEPDELFTATFLHDLGQMVLWLYAPRKAAELAAMVCDECVDPEEAQYLTLGFTLAQLAIGVAERWQLPELLIDSLKPENAFSPRIYGTVLAHRLAREADHGWYRESVSEVTEQIADYLRWPLDSTVQHLHRNAVEAARHCAFYGIRQSAERLLTPVVPDPDPIPKFAGQALVADGTATAHPAGNGISDDQETSGGVCLIPQLHVFERCMRELAAHMDGTLTLADTLTLALDGMHDGLGLNRVVFTLLTPDRQQLRARSLRGADDDPLFSRFSVDLRGANLFSRLMDKPMAFWLNGENRAKFLPMVPKEFHRMVRTGDFMVVSVFVKRKPVGMFYADRHGSSCDLEGQIYQRFKQIALQAAHTMEHLAGGA